jgi:hypothetical protein
METTLFDTNARDDDVPPEPLCLLMGRDNGGHWIVRETHGVCGGMFTTRNAASKYAQSEIARRPGAVRIITEPIELTSSS